MRHYMTINSQITQGLRTIPSPNFKNPPSLPIKQKGGKMIIIPTLLEFRRRTSVLVDYEFEDVNIIPDSIIGVFNHHRLEELLKFCKENPDYHIISEVSYSLYFNKVLPQAEQFYLGQGDANPDLVCFEHYKCVEILERYSHKTRFRA